MVINKKMMNAVGELNNMILVHLIMVAETLLPMSIQNSGGLLPQDLLVIMPRKSMMV